MDTYIETYIETYTETDTDSGTGMGTGEKQRQRLETDRRRLETHLFLC